MLQVAEQGLGVVLGAISQAGTIVKMVQAHYAKSVAPLLEEVPAQAQQCSRGFASMLRAMEDHIMTTLQAGIADFFFLVRLAVDLIPYISAQASVLPWCSSSRARFGAQVDPKARKLNILLCMHT